MQTVIRVLNLSSLMLVFGLVGCASEPFMMDEGSAATC